MFRYKNKQYNKKLLGPPVIRPMYISYFTPDSHKKINDKGKNKEFEKSNRNK
jgi:hypothetical protein